MNRNLQSFLVAGAIATAAMLAGCASSTGEKQATQFDFGSPLAAAAADPAPAPAAQLPTLVVADATGSAALDSERMFYRLDYADGMQARSYANSRWTTNPLQMVTQRFKVRFAQAGLKVLSVTGASNGVPILRVEVDDFIHTFPSASQSEGQLVLRASLFQGHTLVDQKSFSRSTRASSADAAGGARALAASTDAVAADLVAWLATLDLRQR